MSGLWIVLDLIVVAIIAFCVISSARKGFVRTVVEVVGFVLAAYIAFSVSGAVAESVYTNSIEPAIISAVEEKTQTVTANTVEQTVNDIWKDLPAIVKNSGEFFGVELNEIPSSITNEINDSLNTSEIAKITAQKAVRPVAVPLIKSVLGMVVFCALTFVVKLLARVLNKMFKLPLIGGLNKTLGGLLGLIKGVVFAAIICVAISTFIAITGEGFWIFTRENIDSTLLFGLLANIIKI
ncbi:MAG: CvpA family protein [Clostridia bacterium]|nr:CvpA family protein [Clostridia bacterium]